MKKSRIRNRIIGLTGTIAVLCIFYIISRRDMLGGIWHNMGSWPDNLLIFGLAVIVLSALGNGQKVMISVPVGYITGFILAAFFHSHSKDPVRGASNNGWIIWTLSYLAIIIAGIIWQIISSNIRQKASE